MPSPTESEEDEGPYQLPTQTAFTFESPIVSSHKQRDRLSTLGDSSSLFDGSPAIASSAPVQAKQPFGFGQPGPKHNTSFSFESPQSLKMVVEREPPRATPQKPSQPAFTGIQQPQFGKPSPLQNRLQPSNVFNVPKPHQTRPEHHRPAPTTEKSHVQLVKDIAHKFTDPFRSHQSQQPKSDPDVVEIPRPAQAPSYNSYPRPPPIFSSVNAPTAGFAAVNIHQRPYIDLTKPDLPQDSDPALFDDRFGAADPYTYLDAGKANENIKALLEGAFEDDEDKPRTRNRKKKVEAAVADLTGKLQDLEVKQNGDIKESLNGGAEEDQVEDEDDGTVEGLEVKLLPHQVDGVEWMKDKEVGIKKKNGILPKGGILADDMGLVLHPFYHPFPPLPLSKTDVICLGQNHPIDRFGAHKSTPQDIFDYSY